MEQWDDLTEAAGPGCSTGSGRVRGRGGRRGSRQDRARDWVVVRMLCSNALWRLQDPPGTVRRIADDDYLTRCVTVAKAVQA